MMTLHHAPLRRCTNTRKHVHYPYKREAVGVRQTLAHVAICLAVAGFGLLELYVIVLMFNQLLTSYP